MPSSSRRAARRGEPLPEVDRSGRVGSRTARYQGEELALGDKPYVNDMTLPGMLHGAVRWSDHPRARVLRIDTSRAAAHPGVVARGDRRDVPGERTQGLITKDWRQFVAEGETTSLRGRRARGVVAADTRAAAREAAALVDVEYEVLDPVTASAPGARAPTRRCCTSRATCSRLLGSCAVTWTPRSPRRRTWPPRRSARSSSSTRSSSPSPSLAVPRQDGGVHFYSQGQGVWDDRGRSPRSSVSRRTRSASPRSRTAGRSAPRRT